MTALEYLAQHGILTDTATKFGVTWDDDAIAIPIKDESGTTIWTKYRNLNTEPKYKNSAGSHATLFNLHAVKDMPNIVISEGEVDCMRLIQEGIPSVSSTGGSGTFPKEFADMLQGKNLWICFDTDEAGKKGTRKVLELIPQAKVITLPSDVKDVCDYFQAQHTRKDFTQLIQNAQTKQQWELANAPEDYALMSIKDYEDLPVSENTWLIKNILYAEGFCFIFGAEGTGKSFLTLSMAHAIAQGTDWLGQFPTTKTNILFLDKENPHSIIKKRIQGFGITSDTVQNMFWLKYPEKFQLGNAEGYSPFAQALTNTVIDKQIGLIVFDSFVDFMVGNESSAGDTQEFFDGIRELYPRIAYLTLHHENKPSQGVFRNDSQRLRGSSNISAQTITMFRLEAVAKSKTDLTLKQTKAKDAQKLDKFAVRMSIKEAEDGSTAVTGFEYVGIVTEGDEDKNEEAENFLVEVLEQTPQGMSRKEIVELAGGRGISQRTVDRVIRKLTEEELLVKFRKGKEVWVSYGDPIVVNDSVSTPFL